VQHHLVHFAHEYKEEKREEKRIGRMHLVSDTVSFFTAVITLKARQEGFILLRNFTGRISKGLSQTAKAFMLILIADILMGYHSEEAWTSSIELITEHYSLEPQVTFHLFSTCFSNAALDGEHLIKRSLEHHPAIFPSPMSCRHRELIISSGLFGAVCIYGFKRELSTEQPGPERVLRYCCNRSMHLLDTSPL
jgi:hypothetical protein